MKNSFKILLTNESAFTIFKWKQSVKTEYIVLVIYLAS